jgi:hypothetical protein
MHGTQNLACTTLMVTRRLEGERLMAWVGAGRVSKAARETAQSARANQHARRCCMGCPKCRMQAEPGQAVVSVLHTPCAPVFEKQLSFTVGPPC